MREREVGKRDGGGGRGGGVVERGLDIAGGRVGMRGVDGHVDTIVIISNVSQCRYLPHRICLLRTDLDYKDC